ncbi:MAG TPA: C-GCAxxG-C-C family protein [Desulfuromonadales bacterium]
MDQTLLRMMEFRYKGYYCSQILLLLALEAQGKSNPDLIRAMGGLAHGYGSEEGVCGTLTGAACLIGLYAGKGIDGEDEDELLKDLLKDLQDWFIQTYGAQYGGITCEAIMRGGTEIRQACGAVVAETWAKATELLTAAGFDISAGRD